MNNSSILEAKADLQNETLVKDDLQQWIDALITSRFVVYRLLVPIVMCIGVIGNSITIAVLTRRHMHSSTNLYLTALAISDILYLVFVFSASLQFIPGISHGDYWIYWHYFRYALWFSDATSNTSIWLTVAFTIERFIAVCYPLKGKVFCTLTRAKKVVFVIYLLCFFLTATTPHEWKVVPDDRTNGTHFMLDHSDIRKHDVYVKIFYPFSAVVFIILPLILLATFNSLLIHAVKRSIIRRKTITSIHGNNPTASRDSSTAHENKITVMLISVVIMSICCQTPTAILLIYETFVQILPDTSRLYSTMFLGNIFNLLIAVNAAANFILYCVMCEKFRRAFLVTFCSKWYKEPSQHHDIHSTHFYNMEDGSFRRFVRRFSTPFARCDGLQRMPHYYPDQKRKHMTYRSLSLPIAKSEIHYSSHNLHNTSRRESESSQSTLKCFLLKPIIEMKPKKPFQNLLDENEPARTSSLDMLNESQRTSS